MPKTMLPQTKAASPPVSVYGGVPFARLSKWAAGILAIMILCFGLGAAITSAVITYRSFSPVMTMDQWELVRDLMSVGGTFLPPSMLWAQHNEHRILVGRLAALVDIWLFGGRTASLVIEVFLVQIASAFLFLWMFRRFHKFSHTMLITAAGLFFFCMLSPLQMENFLWGWEITYVFPEFAGPAAFACLICYAAATGKGKTRMAKALLALSLAAAAGATASMADGILVWPILSLLAFSMALPRRIQLLIAGVGAAVVALYLYGYDNPPYPTPLSAKILHPVGLLKYVATYFRWSWDPSPPVLAPTFLELMTCLAIAVAIGSSAWALWRARTGGDPLRVFLAACFLFALMAAVLTSFARLDLGIAQATSSRYQVVALLFWACFGAMVLSSLAHERVGSNRVLLVQAVLLALMVADTPRYIPIARDAEARRVMLAHAYAALAYGPDDPPDLNALTPLYPVGHVVPARYAFLRAHNIGPDASEFVSKQARFVTSMPNWGGYQVVSAANCVGFLDGVQRLTSKRALARGWAWDVAAKRPPRRIVLALPGGVVTGFGEVDEPRPDVVAFLKISEPFTGWNGEALVPRGSRLRAFAVLADSRSICQLGDGLDVP